VIQPYRPPEPDRDAQRARRFWLWMGAAALVLFFVVPFGRYWLGW